MLNIGINIVYMLFIGINIVCMLFIGMSILHIVYWDLYNSSNRICAYMSCRSAVDTMFHELVQTYVEREKLANEELRRSRESALNTLKKNRRLYQAYRSLRYSQIM